MSALGKTTYTVTVGGTEYSRTTANVYTHIVVRTTQNGESVVAWSGSEKNAKQAMRQWQGWWPGITFEVRAIEGRGSHANWLLIW